MPFMRKRRDGDVMGRASKWLSALERWMALVGAGLIIFLMLIVMVEITLRYVFNIGFEGVLEGSQLLLVMLVFLGLSYSLATGGQIRVEIVLRRVRPRIASALNVLAYTLGVLVCGLIAWTSGEFAQLAWKHQIYEGGLIQFPLWPSMIWVPIGTAVMGIRFLTMLISEFGRNYKAMDL